MIHTGKEVVTRALKGRMAEQLNVSAPSCVCAIICGSVSNGQYITCTLYHSCVSIIKTDLLNRKSLVDISQEYRVLIIFWVGIMSFFGFTRTYSCGLLICILLI